MGKFETVNSSWLLCVVTAFKILAFVG